MELYSLRFLLFIAVLLTAYYTVFKKWQPQCLLVGSLVFYWISGSFNLMFVLVTALSVWMCGLGFEKYRGQYDAARKREGVTKEEKKLLKTGMQKKKRILLLIVLLLNVGILGFFKYWNPLLALFRVSESSGLYCCAGLLLPLGISFYTFQAISYLVDVYNEKYQAEHNFGRFLLYISYFPQLIQGPINRYDQMSEQLSGTHTWDSERTRRALLLILFGLMKKYAIANLLVDKVSLILDGSPNNVSGNLIIFGILMYSIQQYADFSGGIDIVLGVSRLFGITMAPNFRQPYFSVSLADFWRRWHISLGAWMRDYLFYPFAMSSGVKKLKKHLSQKGKKYLAAILPVAMGNILVFLVVGIWHGAQLHYVLWGLYNGVVIAISEICEPLFQRINTRLRIDPDSKRHHVFRVIRTFVIVNIGWYFDRIEDVRNCVLMMKNSLVHFQWTTSPVVEFVKDNFVSWSILMPIIVCIATLIVIINSVLSENQVDAYDALQKKHIVLRYVLYLVMLFLTLASFMFSYISGGFLYANF